MESSKDDDSNSYLNGILPFVFYLVFLPVVAYIYENLFETEHKSKTKFSDQNLKWRKNYSFFK